MYTVQYVSNFDNRKTVLNHSTRYTVLLYSTAQYCISTSTKLVFIDPVFLAVKSNFSTHINNSPIFDIILFL